MSYLTKLAVREKLLNTAQVYDYIIGAYVEHDSLSNFIRHTNKLDNKERSLLGEHLIMSRPHLPKHKLKLMIMVLIDHPTKVE